MSTHEGSFIAMPFMVCNVHALVKNTVLSNAVEHGADVTKMAAFGIADGILYLTRVV